MKPVRHIKGRTVILPNSDIDTDQIISARFLTTTTKEGLGDNAFFDLRYNEDGSKKPDFPLNKAAASGCEILIAGNNFGCGSSREHAPWALLDYGFKAIISTEIADIFRNNSLKNGLLAIIVDSQTHEWLLENPAAELSIDVESSTITLPDASTVEFTIDGFARRCLLEGVDQLRFLLNQSPAVEAFEENRRWKP
jgi:3-isopropylmalate/(R)-2-methylmalate dehydratase small subunit